MFLVGELVLNKRVLTKVFAELTMIGSKFGPVDKTFFNDLLPTLLKDYNLFLNKAEDQAKERAGISSPRVVLHRLISKTKTSNRNTGLFKANATATKTTMGEEKEEEETSMASTGTYKCILFECIKCVYAVSRANVKGNCRIIREKNRNVIQCMVYSVKCHSMFGSYFVFNFGASSIRTGKEKKTAMFLQNIVIDDVTVVVFFLFVLFMLHDLFIIYFER